MPEISPLARKRFVAQGYAIASLLYGVGSLPNQKFRLGAAGFEAGASMLVGQRFPDFAGGHWHGALIRPGMGLYSGVLRSKTADALPQGAALVNVGTTLGYQYLRFRKLQDKSQTAYGVSAGYQFGYQYTTVVSLEDGVAKGGDAFLGAALSFVRMRYFPQLDKLGLLLTTLAYNRMATSNVNIFKLSVGRGF